MAQCQAGAFQPKRWFGLHCTTWCPAGIPFGPRTRLRPPPPNPDPSDGPPPDQMDAAAQCEALAAAAGGSLIQCEATVEQWLSESVASTGLLARWHRRLIELTCLFRVGDSLTNLRLRGTTGDVPDMAVALQRAAHLARVPLRAAAEGCGRALPLLLAPEAVAAVMAVVAAARRADWVAEGLSCLGEQPGDAIAGATLNVVDDPTLPGAGWRAFDAEGAACRPVSLVDQGRLAGCLYTLAATDAYGVSDSGVAETLFDGSMRMCPTRPLAAFVSRLPRWAATYLLWPRTHG